MCGMDNLETLPIFRASTEWKALEIISEVDVLLTFKGYAPVVRVKIEGKRFPQAMYISAKSLATELKEMREDNNGLFCGLKFFIRKSGPEKTARFEIK